MKGRQTLRMFTMILLVIIIGLLLYLILRPKRQPQQPYYGQQPPYPPQPGQQPPPLGQQAYGQPSYPPQYGQPPSYGQQRSGMGMGGMLGGLAGGAILGYLLNRAMISPNQYEQWRYLDRDQLQNTLASNGVVSQDQFSGLAEQADSGAFNQYLPPEQQQYLAQTGDNSWSESGQADLAQTSDWSSDDSGGDWGSDSDSGDSDSGDWGGSDD